VDGEDPVRVREVRISCPDATGLGADLFRVFLDFGVRIIGADFSTDCSWCFLLLKVMLSSGTPPRWALLKSRLREVCPSDLDALRLLCPSTPKTREAFAVHVSGFDRQGMLHSLAHVLWEADIVVYKMHVTTSATGQVRDTFYVFDNKDELPQPHRVLEICDRVKCALGPDVVCEVEPEKDAMESEARLGGATSRRSCKDASSSANLRSVVSRKKLMTSSSDDDLRPSHCRVPSVEGGPEDLVSNILDKATTKLSPGDSQVASVDVDNATSQTLTQLSLHCEDRKGLLYDIFVALKDVDVRVAYGRVHVDTCLNICDLELFVQDADGCRISDEDLVEELVHRIRDAAALPVVLQVGEAGDGKGIELLVAAAVDAGGRGRPRVTYDVTQGLTAAGLGVSSADVFVGEAKDMSPTLMSGGDSKDSSPSVPVQEIHRFSILLPGGAGLPSEQNKLALLQVIKSCLMGMQPSWQSNMKNFSLSGEEREVSSAEPLLIKQRSPPLLRTMSDAWKGM
jgi:glycine cleavage system regulatory protein